MSLKVIYAQADETGIDVENNGELIKIASGDYDTTGSEICIGKECFYVIFSDETSVTMLAKYNLHVGGVHDGNLWTAYGDEATGIQDSTMLGWISGQLARNGTTPFSSTNYWGNVSKGTYVYDNNSLIYNYVENYKKYLESKGALIEEARLIKQEELEALGCSKSNYSCREAPECLYTTSYWSGSISADYNIWIVLRDGGFYSYPYSNDSEIGVRPVITISKSEF